MKVVGSLLRQSDNADAFAAGGGASLTFAITGGAAAGTTFNGDLAVTIDYSTLGAAKTGLLTASGLTAAVTSRFFGRITAAAGAAEELTGTQATTLLDTFTTSLKGLAPASGGGTINFLRADGTWAAPATVGGSGGSPGGSNTQIQFNNAGAFGGDADFIWDLTNNDLILGGVDTGIIQAAVTNEPPSPSAGFLTQYTKNIAGRLFPKVKGPSGLDYPMQASFWQNNIVMWSNTAGTAGSWFGSGGVSFGTFAIPTQAATSLYTMIRRSRYSNIVTTLQQVLGQRNNDLMFRRGTAAGQGGWFFFARCGLDTWTNGGRFFAGMHVGTTVISANPSALADTVGFCIDDTDAGAISFLTRSATTATKAATGFTAVTGKGYDLYMFCAPNGTDIGWRIVDINTGTEASGTATLTLPTNSTFLTVGVLASNAALTVVNAIQLGINRIYVETDY